MTNKQNEEKIKIVLIGESGVGKTSIISQFVDSKFDEDRQATTAGVYTSSIVKCDDDKMIHLQIWDTAGQEVYRSITKLFYTNTSVVLFVYDITDKSSFVALKSYWVEEVKKTLSQNIIYLLIANKSDLYDNEQVSDDEGTNFAKEIGATFYMVSAKNKECIDRVFLDIAKIYAKSEEAEIVKKKTENFEFVRMKKDTVKLKSQTLKKKKKNCCK